jgi:hypothetical protein
VSWEELREALRTAPTYRATGRVQARRLGSRRDWSTERGSELSAVAGSWELTDGTGRVWTVADEVFRDTYARRPDGSYTKVARVRAVRLRAPCAVPTLEGEARAEAGDWLLQNPGGDAWPVTDEYFRNHYVPA